MARPRLIDRDAVVHAGLALADAHGLDAVTMNAVAKHLGVTPMALYRHVANKSDLLDGMVELLLDELPAPDPALPWDAQLTAISSALRAIARRHRAVFPLLLQRPAATPAAKARRDHVVSLLEAGGVPAAVAAQVERVVSSAALGFAASEAAGRFRGHSRRTTDADHAALLAILQAGIAAFIGGTDQRLGAAP